MHAILKLYSNNIEILISGFLSNKYFNNPFSIQSTNYTKHSGERLILDDALLKEAEDEVIRSALPDEMYKVFHWYKNDEWEKFLGATTQWDLDTYLDCLP